MPKVALAGNKIRREMLLRPDLDDWVLEMMGKPPGWSRNAVIEYCIEGIRTGTTVTARPIRSCLSCAA